MDNGKEIVLGIGKSVPRYAEPTLSRLVAQYQYASTLPPEGALRLRTSTELQIRRWLEYCREAEPILDELAAAGFPVNQIGDLRASGAEGVLPILVRWLPMVDGREVKIDIILALGSVWAKEVPLSLLLDQLETDPGADAGLVTVRGLAASVIEKRLDPKRVTVAELDRLITFTTDPTQGVSRGLAVMALGKLPAYRSTVVPILMALLSDDDVVLATIIALGRLRAVEAKSAILHEVATREFDRSARREIDKALARIG